MEGLTARRVYVRGCRKCGGDHWIELDVPDGAPAYTRVMRCPVSNLAITVTYVPYKPPKLDAGAWL